MRSGRRCFRGKPAPRPGARRGRSAARTRSGAVPSCRRGSTRDGKKGLPQIEYGLLTDPSGRPVAVRVVGGNTADPTAFSAIVQAVKDTFKLKDMVMVGDRGMITSARVQELRELGGFGWVTALRARRSRPW